MPEVLLLPAVREVRRGQLQLSELDFLEFDAIVSETHVFSATITEHAVEKNINVTDHIRPKPYGLEINGIVSNWPTHDRGVLEAALVDRAGDAFDRLSEYVQIGKVFSVFTSIKRYENMAVETVKIDRNAANATAISAAISLKQIRFAETKKVKATRRPQVKAKSNQTDAGKQSTEAISNTGTTLRKSGVSVLFTGDS